MAVRVGSRERETMRAGPVILVILCVGLPRLLAQESGRSVERVSAALRAQSSHRVTPPPWAEPPAKQFGVFTLVPPANPGEIVRLSLPIGELTSRAARGLVRANQSRREAAARLEVQRALTAFTTKPRDPS